MLFYTVYGVKPGITKPSVVGNRKFGKERGKTSVFLIYIEK